MNSTEKEVMRLQKEYDRLVNKPVKTATERRKKLERLDEISGLMFELREAAYLQNLSE